MRETAKLLAILALFALVQTSIFGSFSNKKGIFWGGVKSEADYRQAAKEPKQQRLKP